MTNTNGFLFGLDWLLTFLATILLGSTVAVHEPTPVFKDSGWIYLPINDRLATYDSCRVGDYDTAADREDAIRKLDGCKVDGSIVTVREMVRLTVMDSYTPAGSSFSLQSRHFFNVGSSS